MKIYDSLQSFHASKKPTVVTIGIFDGLHLGHQAVINRVLLDAKKDNAQSVVITFQNHPSEILCPGKEIPLLCTLKHRLKLLEQAGIENVVVLPFTRTIAEQTAEHFLDNVHHHLHFVGLILGHDATLGKDRQGDPVRLKEFAQRNKFYIDYIAPFSLDGIQVSSTKIRALIQNGDLLKAESLLGRPYSIYSEVTTGAGLGKGLGYPTANIDTTRMCLPPYGVYAVKVNVGNKTYLGVANLGIAPTVRKDNQPILETFIFDYDQNLYGKDIEVVFCGYLRPEAKFENLDLLKDQINQDVIKAKTMLKVDAVD